MNKLLSTSLAIIFFFLSSCEIIDLIRGERWVQVACESGGRPTECNNTLYGETIYFNKDGTYRMMLDTNVVSEGFFVKKVREHGVVNYKIDEPENDFFTYNIFEKNDTLFVCLKYKKALVITSPPTSMYVKK